MEIDSEYRDYIDRVRNRRNNIPIDKQSHASCVARALPNTNI